jgi:hypothetical protein
MIKMKAIMIACLSLTGYVTSAQDIKFDKKSGDFTGPSGVVAKLNSEKVKAPGKYSFGMGVGKNYFVTDATGATEYVGYLLNRFQDTLGGPTRWYYTMRATPLELNASRPNFTGSMNTFKEVGETVVSQNLIQADGKMNETAMRDYFKSQQDQYGDLTAKYKAFNDSLVQYITVGAEPVERNMRKDITANEFGKIGQDNTVIGYWELVETPKETEIGSPTYHFVIRNINNGIVCVSWVELSGAHTYTYKNGVRSDENWTVPDLIRNNPLATPQGQQNFVIQLAGNLVRQKLL